MADTDLNTVNMRCNSKRKIAERNVAIIEISYAFLENLLLLPDGTQIVKVFNSDDNLYHNSFNIVVEHPDLPVHREGESIAKITPTMENVYTPRFKDWGL